MLVHPKKTDKNECAFLFRSSTYNRNRKSQTRFKFYHFKSIVSLKILLLGGGGQGHNIPQKPQFKKRKTDLLGYHCPNYYSRLVPACLNVSKHLRKIETQPFNKETVILLKLKSRFLSFSELKISQ